MIKFIDMTGKTEDEAIRRALEQLGLERDDVSVEILERAKSGFLGIGGSYLGDKVLFDLSTKPYWNQLPVSSREGRPQIYFAGNNVDGEATQGLLDVLTYQAREAGRPLRVMLVPISKSGTTMEPLSVFSAVLAYLRQHADLFRIDVTAVTGLDKDEDTTSGPCWTGRGKWSSGAFQLRLTTTRPCSTRPANIWRRKNWGRTWKSLWATATGSVRWATGTSSSCRNPWANAGTAKAGRCIMDELPLSRRARRTCIP